MKPGMKMLMLADREEGKQYNNNRYESPRNGANRWTGTDPYMNYTEPYGGSHPSMNYEHEMRMGYEVPESRRYKNGRYAPARADGDVEIEMRGNYVPSMNYGEERQKHRMQIGFAGGDSEEIVPFSQMTAEKWTRSMEGEDGSKGPHWSMEQVKMLMGQKGVSADPWEFFAAINAVYSDYSKVFKKHGIGDKIDLYVDLAKAFIDDKDAQPDKLARYYQYVVKH